MIPGSGIFPGKGNGDPFQYSCLENSIDRGAWWAIVHGVAKKLDPTERLRLALSLMDILNNIDSNRSLSELHFYRPAADAASLQSCPTPCDPRDRSPPGSPIPGILQARALEWAAISFSNAWKCKVKGKSLSYVRILATPWTTAYQAPLSMGFSRQEYWSGVSLPSPLYRSIWSLIYLKSCKILIQIYVIKAYTVPLFPWLKLVCMCSTMISGFFNVQLNFGWFLFAHEWSS